MTQLSTETTYAFMIVGFSYAGVASILAYIVWRAGALKRTITKEVVFQKKYDEVVTRFNACKDELDVKEVERLADQLFSNTEILAPENHARILSINNSFKYWRPRKGIIGRKTEPFDLFNRALSENATVSFISRSSFQNPIVYGKL